MNKIIAVDFDGTLCENLYPKIGAPKTDVIAKLKAEKEAGTRIILWTCRSNYDLTEAIKWSLLQGLQFDAVNDNLPEMTELFRNNSRKIFASEYWDDKAKEIL